MPAFRNFDNELKPIPKEGPTFQLGGETFHCVPLPNGEVMSRLTGGGLNVATFIEDCLVDGKEIGYSEDGQDVVLAPTDDIKRWRELMADPERPIPVSNLVDIVLYLAGEYGDRPTLKSRR